MWAKASIFRIGAFSPPRRTRARVVDGGRALSLDEPAVVDTTPCRLVLGWQDPSMDDPDRRHPSLDLTEEDLRGLLAGVAALAEQELAAARSGPVFERPPSAAEVDRVVGAD